jgi:hypothetical protein
VRVTSVVVKSVVRDSDPDWEAEAETTTLEPTEPVPRGTGTELVRELEKLPGGV